MEKRSKANYYPYGFVIEHRYLLGKRMSQWVKHWNYKIYHSEEVAELAISNFKSHGFYSHHEFRIRPVYIKLER